MDITYQAKSYAPDKVLRRYVRLSGDGYRFCEVGEDRRWDLRQGIVDPGELPASVKTAADERAGQAFSYVDWPL